jgi:hypothetical protein
MASLPEGAPTLSTCISFENGISTLEVEGRLLAATSMGLTNNSHLLDRASTPENSYEESPMDTAVFQSITTNSRMDLPSNNLPIDSSLRLYSSDVHSFPDLSPMPPFDSASWSEPTRRSSFSPFIHYVGEHLVTRLPLVEDKSRAAHYRNSVIGSLIQLVTESGQMDWNPIQDLAGLGLNRVVAPNEFDHFQGFSLGKNIGVTATELGIWRLSKMCMNRDIRNFSISSNQSSDWLIDNGASVELPQDPSTLSGNSFSGIPESHSSLSLDRNLSIDMLLNRESARIPEPSNQYAQHLTSSADADYLLKERESLLKSGQSAITRTFICTPAASVIEVTCLIRL